MEFNPAEDEHIETVVLVRTAAAGDTDAMHELLRRHRDRLRRMVTVRMDHRIQARVDASDIIQDTLVEAAQRLDEYAENQAVSFYPWLRRLAWQRLIKAHRTHIEADCRSVRHEQQLAIHLSNESVNTLARCLVSPGSFSPSKRLEQREQHLRLREALDQLQPHDREVLVLKYLEQLLVREIAEVIGISQDAVKKRHARALHRLQQSLADPSTNEPS